MAIERGDWVRLVSLPKYEGEVVEVRGSQAKVKVGDDTVVTTGTKNVRITTRPQTGQGRR
jgi:hypothetical protein